MKRRNFLSCFAALPLVALFKPQPTQQRSPFGAGLVGEGLEVVVKDGGVSSEEFYASKPVGEEIEFEMMYDPASGPDRTEFQCISCVSHGAIRYNQRTDRFETWMGTHWKVIADPWGFKPNAP